MDFSEASEILFNCLPALRPAGLESVVLAHVVDPRSAQGLTGVIASHMAEALDERAEILEQAGLRTTRRVRQGIIHRELVRLAEQEDVSLIYIGTQGPSIIQGILLGGVTENVLKSATRPVLVEKFALLKRAGADTCGPVAGNILNRILFPTNWSVQADSALQLLRQIPRPVRREIIILHVVQDGRYALSEKKAGKLASALELEGFQTKMRISRGNPAEEILRIADDEKVSLIAVGCSGIDFIRGILWGGTVERVIHLCSQPVLLRVSP